MAKELRIRDEQNNLLYPVTVTDLVFDDQTGDTLAEQLEGKQETLESGTNIKTINGQSVLGSGNIAFNEATTSNAGLMSAADKTKLDNVASTYETKADATSKQSAINSTISELQAQVAQLSGVENAFFGGIVGASTDIATDYSNNGYSGTYLYMVGSDISSLLAYQYTGSGSPTQLFGGATYDFTDYTEVKQELAQLGQIINGGERTEYTDVEPHSSAFTSNNTRWSIFFYGLKNGDIITYTCANGYSAQIFLVDKTSSATIVKTYAGYVSSFNMEYEDALVYSGHYLKIMLRKGNGSASMTSSEINSAISISVKRPYIITDEDGVVGRLNNAEETLIDLTTTINGTNEEITNEEIEPDGNEFNTYQGNVQDTRWRIFYYNLQNGDQITVSCINGWKAYVMLTPSEASSTITETYQNYSTGTFTMTFADADNSAKCLKILIQNSDGSSFTSAEVSTNVNVTVMRTTSSPQAESVLGRLNKLEDNEGKNKKKISILFIGNSLTQDAVTYVPLVLKEIAPDLEFNLHIWYNGGKTLTQQYNDYFSSDNACQIYSICNNGTSWTNSNNSVKMSTVLNAYTFDIICIQEYFNYKSEYSTADKQILKTVIDYLRTNYSKPFKLVTLFHQPLRSNAESVFNLTKTSIDWMLKNSAIESVVPSGIAIYRAMATSLDSLGDQGHLSPDGTHAQEGLPCLLQAWVTCLWILNQVGIVASINNSISRVTTANYASINVPGPNLGNGVVVGTNAQDELAMDVAIYSYNEGRRLEVGNI